MNFPTPRALWLAPLLVLVLLAVNAWRHFDLRARQPLQVLKVEFAPVAPEDGKRYRRHTEADTVARVTVQHNDWSFLNPGRRISWVGFNGFNEVHKVDARGRMHLTTEQFAMRVRHVSDNRYVLEYFLFARHLMARPEVKCVAIRYKEKVDGKYVLPIDIRFCDKSRFAPRTKPRR